MTEFICIGLLVYIALMVTNISKQQCCGDDHEEKNEEKISRSA